MESSKIANSEFVALKCPAEEVGTSSKIDMTAKVIKGQNGIMVVVPMISLPQQKFEHDR
jgi:hypothetical protein